MAGRLTAGLLPLFVTGIFGFLLAEGHLSFGGGEKDLMLVIPLGVFSLLHLMAFFVLLRLGRAFRRALWGALAWASSGVLLAALFVYLESRLAAGPVP